MPSVCSYEFMMKSREPDAASPANCTGTSGSTGIHATFPCASTIGSALLMDRLRSTATYTSRFLSGAPVTSRQGGSHFGSTWPVLGDDLSLDQSMRQARPM